MPANVIAAASEQTLAGTLLGRAVQVRFVPVGYTFDYGDGATQTSETGGSTWEALGVGQFTPTDTTHPYRERGTYTVTATVAFAPFVNFGSGWRAVAGTVSATSGGYGIQILEVHTALVEHTCIEDPTGPGCPAS